ncbi:Sterol-sensing domain and Patched family-containing protein [Strongyloides ratti]|uniref:Sterol-sensing domain and Patched family-containing protein n=1 Tax=Strongyloides ratti TaxID=34506 RepID=A0A090LMC4_STRRB|nr:Sterol-sensing domain and Patched family-containing protein [Strongyloides ratti]CEF69328.1 Sterol-sensing domain and Patched family-containing protein [Strongyloides ratti]
MEDEEFITCRKAEDCMTDRLTNFKEDISMNSDKNINKCVNLNDEKLPLNTVNSGKVIKTSNSSFLEDETKQKSFTSYLTLKGMFRLFGNTVAKKSYHFIVISAIISLWSIGLCKMNLRDRIRDGYTPTNSPSRYETDVFREFWNSSSDPIMTVCTLTSKDNNSMLREEYIFEARRILNFMQNTFKIIPYFKNKNEKNTNKSYSYLEFCEPFCYANMALEMFADGLNRSIKAIENNKPLPEEVTLTYPIITIDEYEIHLERTFFGVVKKEYPSSKNIYVNKSIFYNSNESFNGYNRIQSITNMKSISVIFLVFRGEAKSEFQEKILYQWEKEIFKFTQENKNYSSIININVAGTEILDDEMMRDGKKITPYFAAGFLFMIIFVASNVGIGAIYYNSIDVGKIIVALGSIMCPILAITSTYGMISAFGMRTNSFMLVMPFLVMGIGVDDAFLMIHSFQRLGNQGFNKIDRMSVVYEEVGPSITITSLTNFISFLIGATTPTPEIRMFCIATSIAMALGYIYELILFGPILTIASTFEKDVFSKIVSPLSSSSSITLTSSCKNNNKIPKNESSWRVYVDKLQHRWLHHYCNLVRNPIWFLFLSVIVIIYLYFVIIGSINIKTKLDAGKILPSDSPLQVTNAQLENIIWKFYHPATIIVNNPIDITSKKEMERFDQLVNEFENLKECKGSYASMIWLRDYKKAWNTTSAYEKFVKLLNFDFEDKKRTTTSETGIDWSYIDGFLEDPLYKHWRTFVKLRKENVLDWSIKKGNETKKEMINQNVVVKFWFTVSYENVSTWDQRIKIQQVWRKIAESYSDLNITVWEANGMFVDQMLSLKSVAISTGILTLSVMTIVCAIFIPTLSVITASLAIVSISTGVFGFLNYWGCDLDPVVMAAVLMSIGMSVDFTAHVSYHFQVTSKRDIQNGKIVKVSLNSVQERLEHTLTAVAWPMIQAGLSTIMCILPLLFLNSYSPLVFVKTIFLVVTLGFIHGLVILPTILTALPEFINNTNIYHTFLSSSSTRSCRYMGGNTKNNNDTISCETKDGLGNDLRNEK